MIDNVIDKNNSLPHFDEAAHRYHQQAEVQQEVAQRLLASLEPWRETLPPGLVIELGCGTGFLSQGLNRLLPQRKLQLTDQSKEMLKVCRDGLSETEDIALQKLDATQIPVDEPSYALCISSFVAQWFAQPAYTLGRWLEAVLPGGLLLAAFPGNESFPEWRKYAGELGLPFTANELPDTEEMVVKLSSDITQVDYYEDTVTQKFESAADFFRHLKQIGAGTQSGGRHLTAKEMRLLIRHWDRQAGDGVTVSWHVVFLAVKKNM